METSKLLAMVTNMLSMQHHVNTVVGGPDWVKANRNWGRAIWVECAELMQHYGQWQWWRKSPPDITQAQLELVDIWHFALSQRLQMYQGSIDRAAPFLCAELSSELAWLVKDRPVSDDPDIPDMFITSVETVALAALPREGGVNFSLPGGFDLRAFLKAWYIVGGEFEKLYMLYRAKAVLNEFRQRMGYGKGLYEKVWGGKEDNWHLVNIVEGVPPGVTGSVEFDQAVADKLKSLYLAVGYDMGQDRLGLMAGAGVS